MHSHYIHDEENSTMAREEFANEVSGGHDARNLEYEASRLQCFQVGRRRLKPLGILVSSIVGISLVWVDDWAMLIIFYRSWSSHSHRFYKSLNIGFCFFLGKKYGEQTVNYWIYRGKQKQMSIELLA